MKKINREIKVDVRNLDIINTLRSSKAVLIGGIKEITTRYDTEDRHFECMGKYIRTMEGFKNTITLKEKVKDEFDFFERDQFDVEIDDIENMKIILKKIGLKPILKMEKYRLKWILNGVRINLDELPFGMYLEIHGSSSEIGETIERLNLNLCEKIPLSYWDIYQKHRKNYNITEENIIFPKDYVYKLMS